MKDIHNNLKITQVAVNAVASADVVSSAIDTQGFDALEVVFDVGNSGDTLSGTLYWTLKLTECDTSNGTFTDVAAADLLNGVATVVIDAPAEDSAAFKFGYRGNKRFVKGVATKTGTHTNGTPIGIIAIQGHPQIAPVA